jgi:ATP phosphoribosyltransferase regulatory subunit
MAAVRGLTTTPRRKAALCATSGGRGGFARCWTGSPAARRCRRRAALLEKRLAKAAPAALIAEAGRLSACARPKEIAARAAALIEDAGAADRRPRGGAAL